MVLKWNSGVCLAMDLIENLVKEAMSVSAQSPNNINMYKKAKYKDAR